MTKIFEPDTQQGNMKIYQIKSRYQGWFCNIQINENKTAKENCLCTLTKVDDYTHGNCWKYDMFNINFAKFTMLDWHCRSWGCPHTHNIMEIWGSRCWVAPLQANLLPQAFLRGKSTSFIKCSKGKIIAAASKLSMILCH